MKWRWSNYKILIAEDDHASRKLYKFMSQYGECDITVDGSEAIEAFVIALNDNEPYDWFAGYNDKG